MLPFRVLKYMDKVKQIGYNNNGVAERDNYLVATARWQGVFGYDKNETLKWIISPHKDWGEAYKPYLLQPLDRNGEAITDEAVLNGLKPHPDFEWVWGVHCPNILPNGHILVFDNGYCRDFIPRLTNNPESYSRVVEYEIDEKEKKQSGKYGNMAKSVDESVIHQPYPVCNICRKQITELFCRGKTID